MNTDIGKTLRTRSGGVNDVACTIEDLSYYKKIPRFIKLSGLYLLGGSGREWCSGMCAASHA